MTIDLWALDLRFLLAALGLAYLALYVLFVMIGEANRKLPDSELLSYNVLRPGRIQQIVYEYRRLYPKSHFNTLRIVCAIGAILLTIASLLITMVSGGWATR